MVQQKQQQEQQQQKQEQEQQQKQEPEQEQAQEEEEEEEEQQSEIQTTLPAISSEYVIKQSATGKSRMPKRIRPQTYVNMSRWNTSTHVKPNPYLPDLADAYPRDPFTKMPPKRDAIEVYRLLQSIHYILKNLFLIDIN